MTEQQEQEFIAWFKKESPGTFNAVNDKNHRCYIESLECYAFAKCAWRAAAKLYTQSNTKGMGEQ